MQPKKTIQVAPLARKLQLALSMPDRTQDEARTLVWALETVLTDSGNYRGFQFDTGHDGTDPDGANYYRRTYYLPEG